MKKGAAGSIDDRQLLPYSVLFTQLTAAYILYVM